MVASALISLAVCGLFQEPAAPPAAAGATASQQATARAGDTWSLGTLEIGGLGGYGPGTVYDAERTSTSIGQVLGRFALHLGPTGDGFLRGNVSFAAEVVGAWIDQDPSASAVGLNVLFRYTWAGERWRPTFLGGAGVLWADEEVPPGETKRNFSPQAGLGVQYLVRPNVGMGVEYRFHHLSNKGASASNPGINTHLILFGVSWYR